LVRDYVLTKACQYDDHGFLDHGHVISRVSSLVLFFALLFLRYLGSRVRGPRIHDHRTGMQPLGFSANDHVRRCSRHRQSHQLMPNFEERMQLMDMMPIGSLAELSPTLGTGSLSMPDIKQQGEK
jgi:hypothetical protein